MDMPIQNGSLDPPVRYCKVPYLAGEDEGQRSACKKENQMTIDAQREYLPACVRRGSDKSRQAFEIFEHCFRV